jgi:uncharacterized protein
MRTRLGFDLDGVLADMHGALCRELALPADAQERRLSAAEQRRVWKRVARTEDFWESLDEIEPGTIARLWAMTEERGWEILFVTARPETEGRSVQLQTQRWLQRHGFLLPSVAVVHGSRGKVASALHLDVLVDDRVDNCVDVVSDSRATAILVDPDPDACTAASARHLRIGVVPSASACLDLLATCAPATDSVLDQLKRLIGIDTERPTVTFAKTS